MAKIYRDNCEVSRSRSEIGGNSVSVSNGNFVSLSGGYIIKAVDTSGRIEGIANETATMASDNQTVAKAKICYTVAQPTTEFEITISGGTVTQADVGKFYNLTSGGTAIDGTTESATGSYVNTSESLTGNAESIGSATDAVLKLQFKLVKFLSATNGIFVANN